MSSSWALITGASAGIGSATAKVLAADGYNLYLLARRQERLAVLAEQIKSDHPQIQIKVIEIDITEIPEVDDLFQTEIEDLQDVEVLVNNAGLAKGVEKIQDGLLTDWDTMIDTNVRGLLYLTRAMLPLMIKKNSGHIVNLGSVAGRWVYPGGGVYCATKHAVRAISEALRMDLIGYNIRVTNIEPGMVHTEFSKVRLQDATKAEAVYKNMTPLKAEDIAECISWCVKRPPHVNIQELVVYPTDQAAPTLVNRKT